MAISSRTRKLLWGRSGNRCTICRRELSKKNEENGHTIYGDECHIISKSPDGPRHMSNLPIDYDGYENLILLCNIHHTEIDTEKLKYNTVYLLLLKNEHERWVKNTLGKASEEPEKELTPEEEYAQTKDQMELLLVRQIKNGKQEMELMKNSIAHHTIYDDNAPEEDLEMIGGFLQNFKDWKNIIDDLEISEQINVTITLNKELQELERRGYLVFGTIHNKKFRIGKNNIMPVSAAIVFVLMNDNDKIMSNPEGTEKGMFAIDKIWVDGFTV